LTFLGNYGGQGSGMWTPLVSPPNTQHHYPLK
jgi:hypothetical protein